MDPALLPALVVVAAGGLCVGSFLNTCIYRVPRGLSVLGPRSQCPHCSETLTAGQLIPLWSYLFQKGRCAHCGEHILESYPLVELAAALLAVALFRLEGFSAAFFQTFGLASVFLAIGVVDYRHRIIPDGFVAAGLIIAFLGLPWSGRVSAWDAGLGFLAGGLGFLAVQALYKWLRGREGMGDGDVKLSAMMGSALGLSGWLNAIMLGSLGGAVVGVFLMMRGRADMQTPIPFGAFLSGAAIAMLLVPGYLL
jgi:leader peptidase (prepilin peptidase)/N-methyltransferase